MINDKVVHNILYSTLLEQFQNLKTRSAHNPHEGVLYM